MARHGVARARPAALVPGTLRVITARMNYRPPAARRSDEILGDPTQGVHLRATRSAATITRCCARKLAAARRRASHAAIGDFGYRVFTDSAPVLEVALAAKSGIGWRGKHTLLLTREAGSWFFLGEIYTDLPLPVTAPQSSHCGTLQRVHRRLPDGRHRRALRARRAPLHLVPHDRASRAAFPRRCGRSSATASTAATTASSCCPWNQFAQDSRRSGLRRSQRPRRRRSRHAVRVDRSRSSTIASRRQRDPAHRLRALVCATSPVGLGNAPSDPDIVAALEARATTRRRWCASMSPGRLARSTRRRAGEPRSRPCRMRISGSADSSTTIGSITASTRTSTIAPMVTMSAGCSSAANQLIASLGLAFQLVARRAQHRRELAARLAVGRQVDQHRREHALLLQRARERYAFAHEHRRLACRRAQRQRPDDIARGVERAQQRRAACRSRIASVLAKRAVSTATTGRPTTGARKRRTAAMQRETPRSRDSRASARSSPRRRNSQSHAGSAQESRQRDQRLREPRQRLSTLLIHRHDLRHDIDESSARSPRTR